MKLVKKSFRLAGHGTSVALEPEFWQALEVLAQQQGKTLPQLVAKVDASRDGRNLASTLRVYVLSSLKA